MIYATTTVYDGLELLPHWIRHYTAAGADRLLVFVGVKSGIRPLRGLPEQAEELCKGTLAQVHPFRYKTYRCANNLPLYRRLRRSVRADDWIVYADLDEFYEYPFHLHDLAEELAAHDIEAVEATFLDRIAEDGSLTPVLPDVDLGSQFPLGCDITGKLLSANTNKVVLCRPSVSTEGDHAFAWVGDRRARIERYKEDACRVHHFRWTAGLDVRAEWKLQHGTLHPRYASELQTLRHILSLGRLPIDDARQVGPLRYPSRRTSC